MANSRFIRKKEDFVCGNCDFEVKGSGYTNHCPRCIWSKHVDVNPGDREEPCGGMMKPERVILRKNKYVITQVCQKCGFERNQTLSNSDDFEKVVEIVKSINQS